MTVAALMQQLVHCPPNAMVAFENVNGGTVLAKSLQWSGIFFDGHIPDYLKTESARAPRGISSTAPGVVILTPVYRMVRKDVTE